MAKRKNQPTPKASNTPIIAMVVTTIAVIALVAWALTRSVDRTPAVPQTASLPPAAVDTSTFTPVPPAADTAWTATQSPITATPQFPPVTPPPVTAAPQQSATSSVPRISVEDLKAQVDRGAVTVIDVRDATSYAQGHIPGALHIPMASVQTEIPNLPKNKPIVAYCT